MRWLCWENGGGGGGEDGVTGGEEEPDAERVSICHFTPFYVQRRSKRLCAI